VLKSIPTSPNATVASSFLNPTRRVPSELIRTHKVMRVAVKKKKA